MSDGARRDATAGAEPPSPAAPAGEAAPTGAALAAAKTSGPAAARWRRIIARQSTILFLAVAVSAIASAVWLRIEKYAGDTIEVTLREAVLTLRKDVPLAVEPDGVSDLISGFEIKDATVVSVQPCPRDGALAACTLDVPPNETLNVAIVPAPEWKHSIFKPVMMVDTGKEGSCPVIFASGDSSHRSFGLQGPGCARVATTLEGTGSPDGVKALLRVTPSGGAPTKELPLSCRGSVRDPCRITIAGTGSPIDGRRPLDVTYQLARPRRAVLLRDVRGFLASALEAFRGRLDTQRIEAPYVWYCRALPGDRLAIDDPRLMELAIGEGANKLSASLDAGGSFPACTWSSGAFLLHFVWVAAGLITLLVALQWIKGRGEQREQRTEPSTEVIVTKGSPAP